MKPKFKPRNPGKVLLVSILFGMISLSGPLCFAVENEEEENLDKMILEEKDSQEQKEPFNDLPAADKKWDIFGFFENENFFHADEKKKFQDSNIIKLESRGRINAKYGTEFFYGKASIDIFFYPERKGLSNPQTDGKVDPQEIYLAGGEKIQFKFGKQLFNWGSADVFPVTNYLDQVDLRELFAKDKDDMNRGVFAGSLKAIFSDFSLELAIVPVHSPALLPDNDNFWAIKPQPVSLQIPSGLPSQFIQGTVTPLLRKTQAKEITLKNVSGVLRAGGTAGILDFHLSYFNGIDPGIIFLQKIEIDNTSPASPEIKALYLDPYFGKIESAGLDMALNWEKLTVRGEAVFTPKKWAMKGGDFTQEVSGATTTLTGIMVQARYFAYTIGADIGLWGEYGRILLEWNQSKFLEKENDLSKEFLSDFLVVRIEDQLMDSRLRIEAGGIIRPVKKKFGYIPTLDVTWDFQNGMSLIIGGMFFVGKEDEIIAPYDNNDFVYTKAKMEF